MAHKPINVHHSKKSYLRNIQVSRHTNPETQANRGVKLTRKVE